MGHLGKKFTKRTALQRCLVTTWPGVRGSVCGRPRRGKTDACPPRRPFRPGAERDPGAYTPRMATTDDLALLERIQRKVLWLSAWMVHQANARPSTEGTKVGGHQASSASMVSLLTALYFHALRPG